MAGQGADQRAIAALRPEVRVDREQRALWRALRADPDQSGRQLRGGAQGVGRLCCRSRGHGCRSLLFGCRPAGLGDEDHVDVAGVVELAAAAFAHRDHREPGRRRAGRQLGPRDREGRLQRRRCQVTQLSGRLIQGDRPGEVPPGKPQQAAPVRDPQAGCRIAARQPRRVGRRLGISRIGANARQQRGPQLARLWFAERIPPAQHPPVSRVPGQVVAEGGAGPEHRGEPDPEARIGSQRGTQLGIGGQPRQAREGGVGIGGRRERLDELAVRALDVECHAAGNEPFCPVGVGEAERCQPSGQGGAARNAHPRTVATPGAPRALAASASKAAADGVGRGALPATTARGNLVCPAGGGLRWFRKLAHASHRDLNARSAGNVVPVGQEACAWSSERDHGPPSPCSSSLRSAGPAASRPKRCDHDCS